MKLKNLTRIDCIIVIGSLGLWPVFAGNPAAAQPSQYDGVYAGTQTLTERGPVANYSQCLKGPFKRKLVVRDGTATYTFNPTYQGQVTGTVSPDGGISGSAPEPSGGVALSGKIEGDVFTGEVWSLYCTYSLELKRLP